MAAVVRMPNPLPRLAYIRPTCLIPRHHTPATPSTQPNRSLSQTHPRPYQITDPTGSRRRPRHSAPRPPRNVKKMAEALAERAERATPNFNIEAGPHANELNELTPEDKGEIETERAPKDSLNGFFAEGEEGENPGEDGEFEPDDITSTAHGELEQVRELRELERVTAWDMPLLFRHAKPFNPPTAAQPLRFRYTTYMGETHPGARKVVMDFSPSALPSLTSAQVTKLLKLLGPRYNPLQNTAKMSCDRFPTVAQNKRCLKDTLKRLLEEARDEEDMFEDIPLDLRHVRVKNKTRGLEFPEAWKLTEGRARYLDSVWEGKGVEEERRVEEGRVVEGKRLLGTPVPSEEEFVTVEPRRRRNAR